MGQPFGGVGLLLKNKLVQLVTFSLANKRFVIISIGRTIFVNVYMPCSKTETDKDIFIDTLEMIDVTLSRFKHSNVVFGGDLNINIYGNEWSANCFNQFMQKNDLILCDNFMDDDNSLK